MLKKLEVVIANSSDSDENFFPHIAEEFLKQGAIVHFVCLEKIKIKHKQCFDRFNIYQAGNLEYYLEILKKLVYSPQVDIVILSEEAINIEAMALIKKWNPKIFQVNFSLVEDSGFDKIIDTSYRFGIKNKSNLTIAISKTIDNVKNKQAIFITPEKGLIIVELSKMAPKLVEIINQRCSKQHYKTDLIIDSRVNIDYKNKFQQLKQNVRKFWDMNLFEPYFSESKMHFGFVATRINRNKFLITARGGDKKNLSDEDIVLVENTDFVNKKISVRSLKKKASLNANVAAKIFNKRPEINIILHSHVSIGNQNQTEIDYAPGTEEDVQEVMRCLGKSECVVELKNHGIIVLGSTPEDIVRMFKCELVYTKYPEFYDLIYHRFQMNLDFVNLVKHETDKNVSVLDLATGTGEVAFQLAQSGYKNITLADKNLEMLKMAQNKTKLFLNSHIASIEDLQLNQSFDLILVRQAINYLMNMDGLARGLKKIYQHLNYGGKLVFNAPNFIADTNYGDKLIKYEKNEWNIEIREMNILQNKILTHSQYCILVKKDYSEVKKIYDINDFGMFTKDEFEIVLKKVGFIDIKFFSNHLSDYQEQAKSLYCVCKKGEK